MMSGSPSVVSLVSVALVVVVVVVVAEPPSSVVGFEVPEPSSLVVVGDELIPIVESVSLAVVVAAPVLAPVLSLSLSFLSPPQAPRRRELKVRTMEGRCISSVTIAQTGAVSALAATRPVRVAERRQQAMMLTWSCRAVASVAMVFVPRRGIERSVGE